MFSDRPFTYEDEISTESFFDSFDDSFTADNGGKPNAAITLVQNDESKDVVVSVFVKAVVKHKDDPDGPTYVYKLEQSDEQESVTSLSDVLGGKDKITYDHCSIFIDVSTCYSLCLFMSRRRLLVYDFNIGSAWRCTALGTDIMQITHLIPFAFVFLYLLFILHYQWIYTLVRSLYFSMSFEDPTSISKTHCR